MANIDIKAIPQDNGLYDIDFGPDGDFVLDDSFDTSLYMSVLAEKRANESEVPRSDLRRGWIGNLFSDTQDFEIGSKLWLLDQSRRTDLTLTRAQGFVSEGVQWYKDQGHAAKTKTTSSFTQNGVRVNAEIFRKNDIVNAKSFDLWEETGK